MLSQYIIFWLYFSGNCLFAPDFVSKGSFGGKSFFFSFSLVNKDNFQAISVSTAVCDLRVF